MKRISRVEALLWQLGVTDTQMARVLRELLLVTR